MRKKLRKYDLLFISVLNKIYKISLIFMFFVIILMFLTLLMIMSFIYFSGIEYNLLVKETMNYKSKFKPEKEYKSRREK